MKDEFLAVLSHELRSPLNAIFGYANLMHGGRHRPEDTPRMLEIILRNARAQQQLIEDLLDVSRVITGKMGDKEETTEKPRPVFFNVANAPLPPVQTPVAADLDTRQQHRPAPDSAAAPHGRAAQLHVRRPPARGWVVREDHPRRDEDVVLDD